MKFGFEVNMSMVSADIHIHTVVMFKKCHATIPQNITIIQGKLPPNKFLINQFLHQTEIISRLRMKWRAELHFISKK